MIPTDRKKTVPDEDAPLRDAYRAAAREQPPAHIDGAILAAARQEAARTAYARRRRWAVPLSAAATLVLAVTLVVFMRHEGVPPVAESPALLQDEAGKPVASAPAPAGPARETSPEPRSLSFAEDASSREKKRLSPTAALAPAPEPETGIRERRETSADTAAPEIAERRVLGKSAVSMPPRADVTAVRVMPADGGYRFAVTVRSDDRDCTQYADWWEVVGTNGELLYRRILEHPHAEKQPFERAGGAIPVTADTRVWVRAHMNSSGYGGTAFFGSVSQGFQPAHPEAGFAANLATQPPFPAGCAR